MGCALRQTHRIVYTALPPSDLLSARAFVQSDLLWASLVKELYDKVEKQLGKEVVRKHRASIAVSDELPSDSLGLYQDFYFLRLRFLFSFFFYFPSHALDFSHIFQLSTNQVPIK